MTTRLHLGKPCAFQARNRQPNCRGMGAPESAESEDSKEVRRFIRADLRNVDVSASQSHSALESAWSGSNPTVISVKSCGRRFVRQGTTFVRADAYFHHPPLMITNPGILFIMIHHDTSYGGTPFIISRPKLSSTRTSCRTNLLLSHLSHLSHRRRRCGKAQRAVRNADDGRSIASGQLIQTHAMNV